LGDRRRGGKSASVEVEFPVEHSAARPCHRLRHRRSGGPHVGSDVVDVQRVQFNESVVTTGNVQLAIDDPEPRQNQRLRQGSKRSPAIAGNVVSVERVHRPTSIVTGSHVNNPIPERRGHVGQRGGHRRAGSPGVGADGVNAGYVAYPATAIKAAHVIDLPVVEHSLGEEVLVRRGGKGQPVIGGDIVTEQI
jgi:hypothetical protein